MFHTFKWELKEQINPQFTAAEMCGSLKHTVNKHNNNWLIFLPKAVIWMILFVSICFINLIDLMEIFVSQCEVEVLRLMSPLCVDININSDPSEWTLMVLNSLWTYEKLRSGNDSRVICKILQDLLEQKSLMEMWLIGARLEKHQVQFDWIMSNGCLDAFHYWCPAAPRSAARGVGGLAESQAGSHSCKLRVESFQPLICWISTIMSTVEIK